MKGPVDNHDDDGDDFFPVYHLYFSIFLVIIQLIFSLLTYLFSSFLEA